MNWKTNNKPDAYSMHMQANPLFGQPSGGDKNAYVPYQQPNSSIFQGGIGQFFGDVGNSISNGFNEMFLQPTKLPQGYVPAGDMHQKTVDNYQKMFGINQPQTPAGQNIMMNADGVPTYGNTSYASPLLPTDRVGFNSAQELATLGQNGLSAGGDTNAQFMNMYGVQNGVPDANTVTPNGGVVVNPTTTDTTSTATPAAILGALDTNGAGTTVPNANIATNADILNSINKVEDGVDPKVDPTASEFSGMDMYNMFQGVAGLGLGMYNMNKQHGFAEDKIGIAKDDLAMRKQNHKATQSRRGY